MNIKIQEKTYYYSAIFIALFIPFISVLAPLGTWIPIIVVSPFILITGSKILLDIYKNNHSKIIFIFLTWMLISLFFFNFNLNSVEKFVHFFILICSGFIVIFSLKHISKFHSIILVFSFSFIFSAIIIIIDLQFEIGLKLWLSKNFDFSNFKNFYTLKSWTGLNEFSNNNNDIIKKYLDNSYDRGITVLTITSIPLIGLCYKYNYKLLSLFVLGTSLVLSAFLNNLTASVSYLLIIVMTLIFYLNKKNFQKYILFILAIYFLFSPFVLGMYDYKKFAYYEDMNSKEKQELRIKKDNNYFEKIQGYVLFIEGKIIHRLAIWSFCKEKILERPFFGHGVFSSRFMWDNYKITNMLNKKISIIPLHPHNFVIQVWLELGLLGIVIFYYFIYFSIIRITESIRIKSYLSVIPIISIVQILFIGQLSYGFWQSWWIAIIIINFMLHNILYESLLNEKKYTLN